ncbi:MAG: type II toxin-antitoxin system RelE/ParE family toxin [candidate division KSB1 bacterium]|nr:type II toxin-antitoxin system RelE/ParE family toxin [candidate division KSB1 bacterium]
MLTWKVSFYRTDSGFCPVEEFLDSLNGKQAQKVVWVLKLIEDLYVVPIQYFKKLKGTSELWEVRVKAGKNNVRILGFFYKDNLIVLNHAFLKKSQKTPKKEIETAEQRKKDFLRRNENE